MLEQVFKTPVLAACDGRAALAGNAAATPPSVRRPATKRPRMTTSITAPRDNCRSTVWCSVTPGPKSKQ